MALRTGHGTGRGGPRVEVLPPDELPAASGSSADRGDRDRSGRFLPGNRAGAAKIIKPGPMGGVDVSDPAFRPFKRWASKYSAHRRRELAAAHGGAISAGVGAIVESAALALGGSRFLAMRASTSLDAELFKQSAALGALARQHELAAWELAAREAAVRKKTMPGKLALLLGDKGKAGERP